MFEYLGIFLFIRAIGCEKFQKDVSLKVRLGFKFLARQWTVKIWTVKISWKLCPCPLITDFFWKITPIDPAIGNILCCLYKVSLFFSSQIIENCSSAKRIPTKAILNFKEQSIDYINKLNLHDFVRHRIIEESIWSEVYCNVNCQN